MNPSDERCKQAIVATAHCPTEPWFPELTELLVDTGWQTLSDDLNLSPTTYSTTSVMQRKKVAQSKDMLVPVPIGGGKFFGAIEFLADDVQIHFRSHEYRFPIAHEVVEGRLADVLDQALEHIALVPSLYASSNQLVSCIHLLKSNVDECDISFSDPTLPFSIFVSVPTINSSHATLRVAEAVIHESMHLQLSLLEKITPIVFSQASKYYSPWKRSYRNASGVLHALYVFTVIDAWLQRLPSFAGAYSKSRREEIAMQVKEISTFECAKLPEVGDSLRKYLFSQH